MRRLFSFFTALLLSIGIFSTMNDAEALDLENTTLPTSLEIKPLKSMRSADRA